jgi:hypothetical protein
MHEPGASGQSLPSTQAGQPYFPDAEWQAFRADDYQAGGTIVVLMGSIFAIGMFLYAGVCWAVHSGW